MMCRHGISELETGFVKPSLCSEGTLVVRYSCFQGVPPRDRGISGVYSGLNAYMRLFSLFVLHRFQGIAL